MPTKQYFSITSGGLKIITYRSENLNGILKEIIDDILWSYRLEPDEITSETFDSNYFRELFDFDENDANALKKLVTFKESLEDITIELNETSNYQFEDPDCKWSLKFEQLYEHTFMSGFNIVNKYYPTAYHIEELLKQTIIMMVTILTIVILTVYIFKLLTDMTPDSPQMQLVINILNFAIVFSVGSSIILSTRIFIKNLADNVKKIKESDEPRN